MQVNFNTIVDKYSSNLTDVSNILRYLHTYPQLLERIDVDELINPNLLYEHLENWLKLCSKFENEIDAEFFKPFWIPIQSNSYGLYIDFSNKNYPLFETRYFFYEPYQWYKKYIVKNIFELLLSPDNNTIKITDIIDCNDKERWNLIDSLFNKN